jgi:ribosomal protein S18 acetylase RimI-like enzyme/ATP adenylyltransferase/5',5'''-P-1,P-4-tetraphosphate phosphorylase II
MGLTIRPWGISDLTAIRRITWQSWISTYSSFIPESDLKSYFDTHYTEASFPSLFNHPSMQGYVAEVESQITGYIRLVFNPDENRIYIPSFHVVGDFQGKGVGTRLLEAAERYATEKGLHELWIGVMVQNRQALVFYRKAGFIFVKEEPFTMGETTVSHLIGYKKLGRRAGIDQKIFARFDGKGNLPDLSINLLAEQKQTWADLRKGYELLKNIRTRDISCKGFSVRLQYNPGRIKSSAADVSREKIDGRQCFLCFDQLPEGQKGILYNEDFLILCNPMPVFPSHFTVSHLDHRRQAITGHIGTLLQLAADFGERWMVLYNGPRCGASAPDHLHFQVVPSGNMPVEKEIRERERLVFRRQVDGISLYRVGHLLRRAILVEGEDPTALESVFKEFLKALGNVLREHEEPMVNIAAFSEGKKWRLLIFPRRKHRPALFFKEREDRMVISPGAIDMGGLVITPVERDFKRLDEAVVASIYKEVSLGKKTVERAFEAVGW